jgi:hypothetical protein
MANNSKQGEGDLLEGALKDLEQAEEHLVHARKDELAAEHEVEEAIDNIKAAEHDRREVVVHVVHVNEAEKASFKEELERRLQAVWDRSYTELEIPREPKDVFQTGGDHPKSLMTHLGLTLEEAREQKVITDFRFGIASETGGA